MSRRSWSAVTTGPPGPSAANYVAVDGPADQVSCDCHGWFSLLQMVPGSKSEKQRLQILTDEVTIKKYLEITPCMFVVIENLVSLPRPLFSFSTFANCE